MFGLIHGKIDDELDGNPLVEARSDRGLNEHIDGIRKLQRHAL